MVVLYVVILFYNGDVSSKRLWIKERNDKRGGWNRGKKGVETSNNPGPCGECGWVCVYSLLLNWWIKITQKACVCVRECVTHNQAAELFALSFCVFAVVIDNLSNNNNNGGYKNWNSKFLKFSAIQLIN